MLGDILKSSLSFLNNNGDAIANGGKMLSGLGSIYSAYNQNKLGNKSLDVMNQQNKLVLDDYNEKKRIRDSQNSTLGSVWS